MGAAYILRLLCDLRSAQKPKSGMRAVLEWPCCNPTYKCLRPLRYGGDCVDWQCAVCADIGPSLDMYYCEKCKYGAPAFCPGCVTVIMEEAGKECWDYKLPLYHPEDPKEDAKERAIAFKLKVESKMKEPRFQQKRERNRKKLEKALARKKYESDDLKTEGMGKARKKFKSDYLKTEDTGEKAAMTGEQAAIEKIRKHINDFITAKAAWKNEISAQRGKRMKDYDNTALEKYGRSYCPHT